MSEFKTIGRNTLIYGTGIAISKLASFIMLPVYTRVLSPADYGVLELLATTLDVVGMIAGIGLASGVFKHLAETRTDDERRTLISTAALASTALAGTVMLLGLVASPFVTHLLWRDGSIPVTYFRLFFVIYYVQDFTNLALLVVQAEERATLLVTLSVTKLVLQLAMTILLVVHLRMGVLGVLLGNLGASVVIGGVLAVYLFGRVGIRFSRDVFARLARFGAPVVVWSLGSFVLTFSDRYFLNYYWGTAEVGVYSLAYKFSFLLSAFAVTPFNQSWEPRRFSVAQSPDGQAVYQRMFLYLNLGMVTVSMGMLLFVRDGLTILVAPAFVRASAVLAPLLLTTIIQQWTGFCNVGLYLKNATGLYGCSGIVGVVAALALNYLLIPRYGMAGAAWATVGAYLVRFVPVYVLSQLRFLIAYPWKRVSLLMAFFLAAALVRHFADALAFGPSVALSIMMLSGGVVAIFTFALDGDDQAFIQHWLRRKLPLGAKPEERAIS